MASSTVVDALRRAPKVAAALVERFTAAHDPKRDRSADPDAADAAIDAGLDAVSPRSTTTVSCARCAVT